jgi:hypothetical protein
MITHTHERYADHPLYRLWRSMRGRCNDKSHDAYKYYGGRGITICERWQHFPTFVADVGERPHRATLDRIDPTKGYEPTNCRWATHFEQQRHQSANRLLTLGDRTQCLSAWAQELGIHRGTLKERIRQGWSHERALTEATRRKNHA